MELLSRLELPNLFITNEVLYRLSYSSMPIKSMVLYFKPCVNKYQRHKYATIFFLVRCMALSIDFGFFPSFLAILS